MASPRGLNHTWLLPSPDQHHLVDFIPHQKSSNMLADAVKTFAPLSPKSHNVSATKSTARRCLFGRMEHKKLSESLEHALNTIDEEKQARWDFDFAQEKPIPGGKYAWMAVEKSEYVPGPYIREYPAKPTKPRVAKTGLKRRLNFDDMEPTLAGDENVSPASTGVQPANTTSLSTVCFPQGAAKASRRVQARLTGKLLFYAFSISNILC